MYVVEKCAPKKCRPKETHPKTWSSTRPTKSHPSGSLAHARWPRASILGRESQLVNQSAWLANNINEPCLFHDGCKNMFQIKAGKKTSEVVSSSIDVGFHEILADFHRFPSIIEETCWKPRHQAIPSQSNSLAPRPCRDRHWCLGISSHLQQQLGTAVTSEDGEHNVCIYIYILDVYIYI